MAPKKISVILPTYRPGGLELAAESLNAQTFKDFEVIIADEHIASRRVLYWLQALPDLNLKFADMSRSVFPRSCAPIAHNECIKLAEGELCVYLSDYALCQPNWLETHWNIWEGSGKKFVAMGPFEFVMAPESWLKAKPPFKVTALSAPSNAPLRSMEDLSFSIFDEPYNLDFNELPLQQGHIVRADGDKAWAAVSSSQDPKLYMAEGPVDRNFYYHKNEAVPTEALLEINGADESFVGLHPYDDAATSLRLHAIGVRWWLAHQAKIKIVQIRQWIDQTKWDAPVGQAAMQYKRVEAAVALGIIRTPNPFDLRKERK